MLQNSFNRPIGPALLLSALATLLSGNASAVPFDAGLFTQNNLRQCSGESSCVGGDPSIEFASDIDLDTTGSVSTKVLGSNLGTQAATSAGYSGDSFAPTISAYAYTPGPVRYTLGTLGLQRYEFVADGEITIGGNLTFTQSGQTQPRNENPRGVMDALFMAFEMENDVFDPENCNLYNAISGPSAPNQSGAITSCLRFDGQDLFGTTVEFLGLDNYQESVFDIGSDAVANGNLSRSLTVSGSAGDVFYLAASLGGGAHLGGFFDSRTTLVLDIDNPEIVAAALQVDSFRPAAARVPEPGALGLLIAGLARISHRCNGNRPLSGA